ncbi:MAG: spermidine synthase [Planctomycetes bacterium]|nr:spermidine synthase [Planctomycetota bacterium]MCB9934378.1 spermidine synthase [Planctomycetota bacterium]
MIRYAATIFISAFLLFQVQPLISRYILPWFGGTPGVWSVALLFFQGALLAGYAYAHFSLRLNPKVQLGVHLVLLAVCLLTLPIIPPDSLKPEGTEPPTLLILALLGASVGLPYFALSSTGPLVQAWFTRSFPKRSPYALYALSNVGSLMALVSYPFVIEPIWGREAQAWNWSYLFIAFALLSGISAVSAFRRTGAPLEPTPEPETPSTAESQPSAERRNHTLLWIAFAGAGTTLLMAYTNQLCLDVASVPFLWVLPLSLYLLSFIFTFAGERWYPRSLFMLLLPAAAASTLLAQLFTHDLPLWGSVVILMAGLFVFCMVCHGEAFRLRPPAAQLTRFYLSISLGGVLGGAFVALVAPAIFSLYLELPAGMLATYALLLVGLSRDPKSRLHGGQPRWVWTVLLLIAVGLVFSLSYGAWRAMDETIIASRNFYGVLRVKEPPEETQAAWTREMISGSTVHGLQFMAPDLQRVPTTYFSLHSGVGLVLTSYPDQRNMRVGVVGLGAGTLAAYAKPGDSYRFYEINERDLELAHEYFKFLENCRGEVQVVLGDARLQLEREEPQQFDVLVLDAFSSDSIPVHLLTLEAFKVYARHLKPGGVICVHVTNRHLNLHPVVARVANELGVGHIGWMSGENAHSASAFAEWIILTNNQDAQVAFELRAKALVQHETAAGVIDSYLPVLGQTLEYGGREREFPLWTDDYSNLFQILK